MDRIRRGLVAWTPWMVAGLWLSLSHPSPAGAQQAAMLTVQGTVQAVRPATGELDVLTGVGQALRVVRMRAAEATVLVSAGQAITLDQIQVGDIVRAQCHHAERDLVMDRIERLGKYAREPDAAGGKSP